MWATGKKNTHHLNPYLLAVVWPDTNDILKNHLNFYSQRSMQLISSHQV